MSETRVIRKGPRSDGPRALGFPERLTLFVTAMHRAQADALLDGLGGDARVRAHAFAPSVRGWDSAQRQARLTHEFGVRSDAVQRVRELVVGAQGAVRDAILDALPARLKVEFPRGRAAAATPSPAVRALAARLVWEATR